MLQARRADQPSQDNSTAGSEGQNVQGQYPYPQGSGYPQAYPQAAPPPQGYAPQGYGPEYGPGGYPAAPVQHGPPPGYPVPQGYAPAPYPQNPQVSGYPQAGPPPQGYAQMPAGYPPPGYPQQAYPQQAAPQQAAPQQAYPQQAAPQQAYPQQYAPAPGYGGPQAPVGYTPAPPPGTYAPPAPPPGYTAPPYPQNPHAGYPQQAPQGYGAPQQLAHQQTQIQQIQPRPAVQVTQDYPQQGPFVPADAGQAATPAKELESGLHPAAEDRTVLRPAFTAAMARAIEGEMPAEGNAAHNDTVIALSPFADPFAAQRLQRKVDSYPPAGDLNPQQQATLRAEDRNASEPPPAAAGASTFGNASHSKHPKSPRQRAKHLPNSQMSPNPAPVYAPGGYASQSPAPMGGANVGGQFGGGGQYPSNSPNSPSSPNSPNEVGSAAAGMPGLRVGVRGIGSVDLSRMNKHVDRFGAGMVPVMGLAAIVIATFFDVLFLKLPFGGSFIGRLWYLTTAASFAGAGYGSALMTRARKGFVFVTAAVVALLYGAADIGIESVLEGATFGGALGLAIQGVVIAAVTGIGGAIYAYKHRP